MRSLWPFLAVPLCLWISACAIGGVEGNRFLSSDGGDIQRHLGHVREARGPMVLDGRYVSAGTLYLTHPNVCVTPDSQFTFHAPVFYHGDWDAGFDALVAEFAKASPSLAAWYRQRYRSLRLTGVAVFETFTGAEMARRFGFRLCNG